MRHTQEGRALCLPLLTVWSEGPVHWAARSPHASWSWEASWESLEIKEAKRRELHTKITAKVCRSFLWVLRRMHTQHESIGMVENHSKGLEGIVYGTRTKPIPTTRVENLITHRYWVEDGFAEVGGQKMPWTKLHSVLTSLKSKTQRVKWADLRVKVQSIDRNSKHPSPKKVKYQMWHFSPEFKEASPKSL